MIEQQHCPVPVMSIRATVFGRTLARIRADAPADSEYGRLRAELTLSGQAVACLP